MNEKLLQQAMAMFDSQEKWDAFLELWNLRSPICEKWKWGLINRLRHLFGSTIDTNKWQFNQFNDGVRIYPKELGLDHMEVRIKINERMGSLWINPNIYDSVKVRQMIQNHHIVMPLLKGFEYNNDWDIWSKPFDNDICASTLDSSCYIWGHDTERVAKVLFETYIKPFMTDEIADFFVKVSEESKKQ